MADGVHARTCNGSQIAVILLANKTFFWHSTPHGLRDYKGLKSNKRNRFVTERSEGNLY